MIHSIVTYCAQFFKKFANHWFKIQMHISDALYAKMAFRVHMDSQNHSNTTNSLICEWKLYCTYVH